MPRIPVLTVPHIVLSNKVQEIIEVSDWVHDFGNRMAETLYWTGGLGLAANQVGLSISMIVFDVDYADASPEEKRKNPTFIINPEISKKDGEVLKEEGCLSVPGFILKVKRAERVEVWGLDLKGNPLKIEADGLLACVIQHEIDHLNGITILDHASSLKRNFYLKQCKKRNKT